MEEEKLNSFMKQFVELTKKPDEYLSLEENQVNHVKNLTKNLYDFTKEKEYPKNKGLNVLKKLVIANLDEEQVWQQIDLQNNSVCDRLVSEIAYLSAKKDGLKFPLKEKKKEIFENKQNIENKIVENKVQKKIKGSKKKSSIVDDKFFKLHEMEKFLDALEKKESGKTTDNDINDDDVDEEEEYFDDDLSSLDDENEKQLYYQDFFDEPEQEMYNESDEASVDEGIEDCKRKKVKFMLDDKEVEDKSEDDVENLEGDELLDNLEDFDDEYPENNLNLNMSDDDDDDNYNYGYNDDDADATNDGSVEDGTEIQKTSEQPSTFEARQERLKNNIKNLEEEALKEKPWQLKGEVSANNRPQNSLLEEYVEFDIAARPAPVLTEKSTLRLEDIIIQRIKDMAWDDVVRKIKPVDNEIEYKKKLVLDQEKSKLSLAQIYENEYLKQLESKNEEMVEKVDKEPPEHEEIRNMMNKLFSKLDALSNFHFTPKLVTPEVKIINNLPAITMEEVAPVATSDAALLAPEEVKPKVKGDLIGKSERSKTDKKRERRKRKLKQKLKYKQMEAKIKLKLDKSNSKDLQKEKIPEKLLQKITKSSNVTQLNELKGDKHVKSSNAFFSKLQNETKSLIKKKGLDINKVMLSKKLKSKKSTPR